MTKSRAEVMAEEFNQSYRPSSRACQCDCGFCTEDAFKAGMKAMLKEALTYCSSWDGGDSAGTHDANDLYEHLKKLMETNLKEQDG